MRMIINRPLSSGAIASDADGKTKLVRMKEFFDLLAVSCPDATLLLGTKSVAHLHEDLAALQESYPPTSVDSPGSL